MHHACSDSGCFEKCICGMWHVACGMWHVACGMWHVACSMQHAAPGACIICKCLHVTEQHFAGRTRWRHAVRSAPFTSRGECYAHIFMKLFLSTYIIYATIFINKDLIIFMKFDQYYNELSQ